MRGLSAFAAIQAFAVAQAAQLKGIPAWLDEFMPKAPPKPGCYIPGGPRANVRGTYIRNPKIAAHVNAMHQKWHNSKFGVSAA